MNTTTRKPANHVLHLFLTVITFGLWLPGWIIAAMVGRKETVTTHNWVAPNLHHQVQGDPWARHHAAQGYSAGEQGYPPVGTQQYNSYSGTWG